MSSHTPRKPVLCCLRTGPWPGTWWSSEPRSAQCGLRTWPPLKLPFKRGRQPGERRVRCPALLRFPRPSPLYMLPASVIAELSCLDRSVCKLVFGGPKTKGVRFLSVTFPQITKCRLGGANLAGAGRARALAAIGPQPITKPTITRQKSDADWPQPDPTSGRPAHHGAPGCMYVYAFDIIASGAHPPMQPMRPELGLRIPHMPIRGPGQNRSHCGVTARLLALGSRRAGGWRRQCPLGWF